MHYWYLVLAILGEMLAIHFLKTSEGFTRPIHTLLSIVCYTFTFYFLMLALKVIPVGIAYAIWAGMGIVMITLGAYYLYDQILDIPAMIGVALIVSGVVVIHLFSDMIIT